MSDTKRLEVLLQAAFVEWMRDLSHEAAVAEAESGHVHPFFRAIALNAIARFSGAEPPPGLMIIMETDVPRERAGRRRELAPTGDA